LELSAYHLILSNNDQFLIAILVLPSGLDDLGCDVIVGEGLRRFGVSVLLVTDVEEEGTSVTAGMSEYAYREKYFNFYKFSFVITTFLYSLL